MVTAPAASPAPVPPESEGAQALKVELEKMREEIKVMKEATIMKGTVEGPIVKVPEVIKEATVGNMLKALYGVAGGE